MSGDIVITEKNSQARDVRAALGNRHGPILPAEGHLITLREPEEVNPVWKRWSAVLLRPEGLFGTKPATGGNKESKLKAIRAALRSARRVWLATDCDREGQLIGQEILEHCDFRGEVMRVMFTAQDPKTIRDAFAKARPNGEYAHLYAAAVARQQSDQIYNLSLTRAATVLLGRGERAVIGIGRVKTPTLGIVCRRELEIRAFRPQIYFEVMAMAHAEGGVFPMRHAPAEKILKREDADAIAARAEGFTGPLSVKVEDKRQAPPRLHDLPTLQRLCGARFGWSAAHTLEVAQSLYDGEGKKLITYPRAESRYLPESLIPDVPAMVAALTSGKTFGGLPMPPQPIIRRGKQGHFWDKGLEGVSHHAIVPNVNTVGDLRAIWPRLSADERRLFMIVVRSYLAALMPDFRYRQTTVLLDVLGHVFRAIGRQPIDMGWRAAFGDEMPEPREGSIQESSGRGGDTAKGLDRNGSGREGSSRTGLNGEGEDDQQILPPLRDGETAILREPRVETKETKPPPRYSEGTLIEAMVNAWRFVENPEHRERLKEAKGIGTPATRAEIIQGLRRQDLLTTSGKNIVPTERGLALFGILAHADPALVDPAVTAKLEFLLDEVLVGRRGAAEAIDAVCGQASRIIGRLLERPAAEGPALPAFSAPVSEGTGKAGRGGGKSGWDARKTRSGAGKSSGETGQETRKTGRKAKRTDGMGMTRSAASAPAKPRAARAKPSPRTASGDAAPAKGTTPPETMPPESVSPESMPARRPKRSGTRTARHTSGTGEPMDHRTATVPPRAPARARAARGDTAMRSAAISEGETALKIPFGNKEAALTLGARYRSGGWFAPPGTDLAPLREKGWVRDETGPPPHG